MLAGKTLRATGLLFQRQKVTRSTTKEIFSDTTVVQWVSPRYTAVGPELRAGEGDGLSLGVGAFIFDRILLFDRTLITFCYCMDYRFDPAEPRL